MHVEKTKSGVDAQEVCSIIAQVMVCTGPGIKEAAHLERKLLIAWKVREHPTGEAGLTEEQARAQHGENSVKVYQSRFTNMQYAVSQQKPATVVKLIVVGPKEKVVGCHMIGQAADEIIQGFAVALKMGATKSDFDNTVAIHPTAAEELVTLR